MNISFPQFEHFISLSSKVYSSHISYYFELDTENNDRSHFQVSMVEEARKVIFFEWMGLE
jgi:hypothetical protein